MKKIREQILQFKPNYVFTHLTFHDTIHKRDNVLQMFSELYKRYDIKFIHTCNDARTVDRYMNDISNCIYTSLVGSYDMVENCEPKWKVPTFYTPYSALVQHNIAEPINELKFKEPVFTGSVNAHSDRKKFINLLRDFGVKLKIFGAQSDNDMRHRTQELSSSANCIMGLCTGYRINFYIDVRPYQYLGSGACMIMRKFKGMDNIIPPDLYYSFEGYGQKDAKYVKETYQRILKTDTWPMRCKAFRYMQQNHSSKVRIKQILDVLEGKKDSIL
ncbi:MAG: hypothetical protein ACOCQD_05215 [archaeon]